MVNTLFRMTFLGPEKLLEPISVLRENFGNQKLVTAKSVFREYCFHFGIRNVGQIGILNLKLPHLVRVHVPFCINHQSTFPKVKYSFWDSVILFTVPRIPFQNTVACNATHIKTHQF